MTGGRPTADNPGVTGLVGRSAEQAAARQSLDEALGGSARLLLVAGEPGIGKTRLAEDLAEHATTRGAAVVWGRAWESGGAPALWPWVQVLRGCLQWEAPAQLPERLGADFALVRDLCHARGAGGDTWGDPSARFRVFDAVQRCLEAVSAYQPLVVVLDDVHAADPSSVELLRFVARSRSQSRLLLVTTFRDTEALPGTPVGDLVESLVSESRLLTLRALDRAGVAQLARRLAPDLDDEAVDAIALASGGNPLLVQEAVRAVEAEGHAGLSATSRLGLRAAIGRRTGTLPPPARRLLAVAAVLGRRGDVAVLLRLAGDDTRSALEQALRSGLLRCEDDSFVFAHDLVRSALYDEIPTGERERLHGVAASGLDPVADADQVAHHYALAGEGMRGRAIEALLWAGEAALGQLAYETAEERFGRALDLAGSDTRLRCDALTALGGAQGRIGRPDIRATLAEAADLALALGDGDRLARALLTLSNGLLGSVYAAEDDLVHRLRAALESLPPKDPALRALALATLVVLLAEPEDQSLRRAAVEEALHLAQEVGDDLTTAEVLRAAVLTFFYDRRPEQVRWVQELLTTTHRLQSGLPGLGRVRARELEVVARRVRTTFALEAGDVEAFEREAAVVHRLCAELDQPRDRFASECLRVAADHLSGRLDVMEQRCARIGDLVPGEMIGAMAQLVGGSWALYEQDRLGEAEELLVSLQDVLPRLFGLPLLRAMAAVQQGRLADARALVDLLSARVEGLPFDAQWPAFVAATAMVAAEVGDRSAAELTYRLLLPHRDRHVVISFGQASCYLGSAELFLGMAGRRQDHLERAVQRNASAGAPVWAARAQIELARVLPDPAAARREVEAALRRVEGLPAHYLRRQAREILAARLDVGVDVGADVGADLGGDVALSRDGDSWLVRCGARSARLGHIRGLEYLDRLVASPGTDIAAADLLAGEAAPRTALHVVLDDRARREYRARVEELARRADEREDAGDDAAASALRRERAAVLDELAAATGLGGRPRGFSSGDERARVSVTKALGRAVQRIGQQDPLLGAHFERSVVTGTFCRYRPEMSQIVPPAVTP